MFVCLCLCCEQCDRASVLFVIGGGGCPVFVFVSLCFYLLVCVPVRCVYDRASVLFVIGGGGCPGNQRPPVYQYTLLTSYRGILFKLLPVHCTLCPQATGVYSSNSCEYNRTLYTSYWSILYFPVSGGASNETPQTSMSIQVYYYCCCCTGVYS